MKLYEIARQAIVEKNFTLAESLAKYLSVKHNLNHAGIREYLAAHEVDPNEFEELVNEA